MADAFAIAIMLFILGTCLYEAGRSRLDAIQPIYFVLIGFLGVYCFQYAYAHRDLRAWFSEAELAYAMGLALAGLAAFVLGYYSRLATWLALRLPKPHAQWRPGMLTPYGLGLVALSIVGHLWFVARSGGADVFYSQPRGAGAYEGTTAYLYNLKHLLTPGIICLAVDNARRPRPWRLIWLPLALGWFAFNVAMGQRSGVFSVGVLTVACLFVPRVRKAPPAVVIPVVALVLLAVGFVSMFRSEFYAGSDLARARSFAEAPLERQVRRLAVSTATGGREELSYKSQLAMYVNYVRIFPQQVPFDYGQEYSQLLIAWIPRVLWTSRPDWREEKRAAIFDALGTSHLNGPSATMLGMYYTHFGALSLVLGAYLTGALLGSVARMRDLWPQSMGVMLVFLSFFSLFKLAMGNGPIHGFRFWGPWLLAPIIGAHWYLRFVAGPRRAPAGRAAGDRAGAAAPGAGDDV